MIDDESIVAAANELGVAIKGNNFEENRRLLSEKINELIRDDFSKLISILYRMDVNEDRLRSLLQQSTNMDAGNIIADLIIERQSQKIKSRRQSAQRENDIDENEKW
jgi:N-acetylglucosamine kinase-like BadF-type ATPase